LILIYQFFKYVFSIVIFFDTIGKESLEVEELLGFINLK